MPKILSFGDKSTKVSKEGIFKKAWNAFSSQNKYTKFFIFYAILITAVTPAIISSYLIFNPQAASNNLLDPWTSAPSSDLPTMTGISTQPQSASSYTVDSEIKDHFDRLNNYRMQNGVGPLTPSKTLTDIAKWMANDMASKNYFPNSDYCGAGKTHCDSTGRDPFTRMCDLGYCHNTWKGENLAAAYSTGIDVLNGWKASSGHNSNMLSPNYTAVGIYRAFNPNSTFGWYWAQEFGGYTDIPVDYYAPPPASASTPTPMPSGPAGFIYCATEGNTCSFSGTAQVAFGANNKYSYGNFTNNVVCSWQNFPDPAPGVAKNCFYKSTISVPTISKGDTNCNGKIDTDDANLIHKFIAGSISGSLSCNGSSSLYLQAADTDDNGDITSTDALHITRFITGLPSVLNGFTITNTAYLKDFDKDGFMDGSEIFMGTDPSKKCGIKAWPADFDDNKSINVSDVLALKPGMNTKAGQAKYNFRLDLNNDGNINVSDATLMKNYIGKKCS